MTDYGFPFLYALGLWWFSTGLVLYLDNLPRRTFRWTLLGASLVMTLATFGLAVSSTGTGLVAAYLSFTFGVIIWGVLEMTYFTGLLVGPRKHACPPDCSGWRRFWLAVQTSLYHELIIIATAVFLILMTWGEPNQVGTWSFIVLWLMRWSAKLNLFLGVPNLNEEWLPEHLRYLRTYMPKRAMNLLFPVSVTLSTLIVMLLVLKALDPASAGVEAVRLVLTATLLALGILEHWFLVLPLPDEALWAWALSGRKGAGQDGGGDAQSRGRGTLASLPGRPGPRRTKSVKGVQRRVVPG